MIIGVPKEIKIKEFRVGLTPASVKELVKRGHTVIVEKQAGYQVGFSNDDYMAAGAKIEENPEKIFEKAEMIIKVKEPQINERKMLRENQILFTYLHLAPDPEQTKDLIKSGATCVAYETVTDDNGKLPLLAPMSEVAGRLSVQVGSYFMLKHMEGSGKLIGGVPGVEPSKVVILGGGVVGLNATKVAVGMGANVCVMDRNLDILRFYDNTFHGRVKTLYSNDHNLEVEVSQADMVIGGVYNKGAKAPHLVSKELVTKIIPGSVLVDVSIDQGGCFETSKATNHDEPTYIIDGVIHYCVANMPGSVPRTSTLALNNAILPFAIDLANDGKKALLDNPNLINGLNIHKGMVTEKAVSKELDYNYIDPKDALKKH